MKSAIIGFGEIGKSLFNVLKEHYEIGWVEPHEKYSVPDAVDILHICFPFSESFVDEVKKYQEKYQPKFTIIHSTTPVGMSRKLGAIFSPVVGLHPHLETSLRTFTKFLGGKQASEVADYFRRAGMKVYLVDKQETLELAKLSQTTFYALMIEYIKDLKRQCDVQELSFAEVYTVPSQEYNQGYEKLGYPEYKMPLLIPILKKQGGHCTVQNCSLWDTTFTKLIKELNK